VLGVSTWLLGLAVAGLYGARFERRLVADLRGPE